MCVCVCVCVYVICFHKGTGGARALTCPTGLWFFKHGLNGLLISDLLVWEYRPYNTGGKEKGLSKGDPLTSAVRTRCGWKQIHAQWFRLKEVHIWAVAQIWLWSAQERRSGHPDLTQLPLIPPFLFFSLSICWRSNAVMGKHHSDNHICLWGPTQAVTSLVPVPPTSLPTDPHSSLFLSLELSPSYCPPNQTTAVARGGNKNSSSLPVSAERPLL